MADGTYFMYFITNIQGSQFSCFTQSGEEKEYDGTLSAKQGYVVITDESTTNGVHKYRIANNGSFNGDNGDYSKWEALPTYTLPSGAISGNDFTHTVSGSANVPLTEYHGVKVYGTPQVIYEWSIKSSNNINIYIEIDVIGYKDSGGNVVFNCTVSGDTKNILRDNSIILSYGVVTTSGSVGSYSTRVTSIMTSLYPGISYVDGKTYYIDMSSSPTVDLSSGTSGEYHWNIIVSTGT